MLSGDRTLVLGQIRVTTILRGGPKTQQRWYCPHWTTFITTNAIGGEFGFYIDEYDASGNWISGQWKGMLTVLFTGIENITYVPSSANVKTVRLQYYQVPNSTFDLYLDSVGLN